jgi:two-component system nitrogen regulation sensor histidine kinase NtrY
MASNAIRDPAFLSAAGWRTLAVLALAGLSVALARSGYPLSAALAGAAAGLSLFDLWRVGSGGSPAPEAARSAAADARRLEEALALIDGVSASLFVTTPDGSILFANRAGRALAGAEAGRMEDVGALGPLGAAELRGMPPGSRRLIEGEDSRALLASVQDLIVPGSGRRRLISLQPVAGELDAVQLGAWHRMTRVLAHELMNSLTPVTSLAESLSEIAAASGADPRIARAAGTIGRRSAHLLAFVDRYRQVADLPAPVPADIPLARLLDDLKTLIGAELRGAGVDFTVPTPAVGATIFADPVLIEQALLNLVRNAAEAVGGRAKPLIRVEAEVRRDRVLLRVADNGPGFDPRDAEELFVPFYTTKPRGAGIGLALVRAVVTAHGGRARAVGTPTGATFELELPSEQSEPADGRSGDRL